MKLSPTQEALVQKVADARAEEREALAAAEAEYRNMKARARTRTNAAAYEAWRAGVSKARITRDGLGISSPTATDDRLREFAADAGTPVPTEGPVTVIVPPKSAVSITRDDTGYTVALDEFTHPDVGVKVSGSFVFNTDDDMVFTDRPDLTADDPLFAERLWATTEVQEALNA